MIKVNDMTVEIEGNADDLCAECTLAVAGTANVIAGGDDRIASATLYALFMGAVKVLREYHNIDVDTSLIGNQIANATKE